MTEKDTDKMLKNLLHGVLSIQDAKINIIGMIQKYFNIKTKRKGILPAATDKKSPLGVLGLFGVMSRAIFYSYWSG